MNLEVIGINVGNWVDSAQEGPQFEAMTGRIAFIVGLVYNASSLASEKSHETAQVAIQSVRPLTFPYLTLY